MNHIRKSLDREEALLRIASEGQFFANLFDTVPQYLVEQMSRLHGQEFRAVIDHDVPMILIRPK